MTRRDYRRGHRGVMGAIAGVTIEGATEGVTRKEYRRG